MTRVSTNRHASNNSVLKAKGSRVIVLLLLMCTMLSFGTTIGSAQPMVARNATGTTTTSFLLGTTSAKKTQQLYLPSELPATVARAGDITTLYFMYASTTEQSFTDLTISIGQTTNTALTSTFETGLTQVFSGAVTIPAGTAGNWFALPLTTPYGGYDSTRSLIVETKWETNPTSTSWTVRVGTSDPSGTNRKVYASTTSATTGTLTTSRTNFGFDLAPPVAMVYDSSRAVQASTLPVIAGSTHQLVLQIPVYVHGTLSPLSLTQFDLNTTGTTNTADLVNAKIFFTGYSPVFETTTQFGSTYVSPSGSYAITGSQQLGYGANYFWLTYDISGTATEFNAVDAECTSLTVAAAPHTPAETAPAGDRTIRYALAGTKTIGASGTYTTFASALAELNLLGVGTGGVTFDVDPGGVFNETPLRITATGTASNPIVFQGTGALGRAVPVLNVTGTSATNDAAIRLVNSDYVTFNTLDVRNAGTSASDWIEFGFHFVDSTGTDGCQYNTIKNCIVTLDTANSNTKAIYTYTDASGASGLNSYNSFLNNVLQNTHSGYYIDGQGSSNLDEGNVIGTEEGGTSLVTTYGRGTAAAYGIYSIYQNNLRIFNTTVSDGRLAGSGSLYGIYSSASSTAADTNVVTDLANAGTGAVYGLYLISGATHSASFNKIYNLSSAATGTGVTYGLASGASSEGNIFNNMVYDLRSPATTSTTGVIGIYPSGAGTFAVFHNTVYLDYVAAVAANTSSALYVTTAALVNIKNNIFVNVCDMTAGTRAVALRKSTTSYANLASNNNLWYAGTPGPKNLIFYDGTNSDQTLAAMKARIAPNDQSSVTENPPFVNATSPYDVHLSTVDSTKAESGGQVLTTPFAVDVDIDLEPRYGAPGYAGTGSAPDLGADEFDGVGPDVVGPTINYTKLPATPPVGTVSFPSATITDPSGVDTTAGLRPRLYYKKSTDANTYAGNTSGDNGWKYVEGAGSGPYSFTINHSLLFGGGPVIVGDTIQYFVVAQDMAPTPNVGINLGTFTTPPTSVVLSAGNFPLNAPINQYVVRTALSGTYTIGGASESSATLKEFFDSLNVGVLTGSVTGNIVGNTTETATASLSELPEFPLGSNFTVTLSPTGNRSVSGDIAGAVVKLNGADRVTIDGLNAGGNSLSISNTGTSTNSAAIWVSSLGTNLGATNNTIKNCNISAGSNNVTSTFGIIASGTTISTSGTGADNDNLTIQNNTITRAYYGIYAAGTTSRRLDSLVISGNTVGHTDTAQTVRFHGIDIASAEGALVTQNTIFNMEISTSVSIAGIDLGSTCLNSVVSRNLIHGLHQRNTTGYGAYGIVISTTTSNTDIMIANNVVYDILTDGATTSTSSNPFGIRLAGGSGVKVYYNSVNMYGSFFNATTSDICAALMVTTTSVSNLDVRNNVFSNSMTGGPGAKAYAIYGVSGVTYGTIDYNDYYVSGANAVFGYNGADVTDLASWQGFTGQDAASLATNPQFNAPDILAPAAGSPLLLAGTTLAGVTVDFLGVTRGSPPTIGAYEQSGDFQAPAITYTPLPNSSSTTSRSFTNVVATDLSGVNTTTGRPRVYYKKSSDANTYVDNTSGTIGWKYAEANGVGGSPFDFTIDYSRLFGGTVTAGDVIQYFVVAQDLNGTPNVGINSGIPAVQPSSVALTSSAFPMTGTINLYYVSTVLSGTIQVGTGQTYTSLTGAFGAFAAVNNNVLSTNLVLEVVSDLTEDGTVGLGSWAEQGAGNYTLTIRSSAATERLISGATALAMIRLNGADRVMVDGRVGGSGRYLRFRNSSTTSPTILFENDATNDTVRNCFIEGANASSSSGVIFFSTGTGSGNDNITLMSNVIRDRSDATGVPANLIYSAGSVAAAPVRLRGEESITAPSGQQSGAQAEAAYVEEGADAFPAVTLYAVDANSDNTITGNDFSNFTAKGINIPNTGNGDNWSITNNYFYDTQVTPPSTAQTAISLVARSSGNVISGNTIGGSEPGAGGTAWTTTGANAFIGIEVAVDSITPATISNNIIRNINRTSTSSATFNGISLTAGRADITGNIIGDTLVSTSIQNAGSSTTHGINVTATSVTAITTVSNNVIAGMSASGTGASVRVRGISFTGASLSVISGNLIRTLATMSGGSGIAAGNQVAVGLHFWPGGTFYLGDITGNTFADISAENTGALGSIATGAMLTNLNGRFSRNRIYDIRNYSTGTTATLPPIASGVYLRYSDSTEFSNNMIAVGYNQTTNTQFNGVWNAVGDKGNDVLFAYNSISVSGTASAGDLPDFAFMRGDNTSVPPKTFFILRDNILSNTRTGGTGKHYAIGNQGTAPVDTGWTSNYNVLHAADTAFVGLWSTTDLSFTGWKATSGVDTNSVTGNPLFTSATNLHIASSSSPASNAAAVIPSIAVDYDGDARSGSTPDIGADEFTITTVGINTSITAGWNMISNPVTNPVPGDSVKQLFPTSLNQYAFEFVPGSGYQQKFLMANGKGYWGKFPSATTNTITGLPRLSDSLSVVSGWNMVGSISNAVDTSTIVSVPPGLRASNWFGYTSGYNPVTQLTPGKGYWVKASGTGKFVLTASPVDRQSKVQAAVAGGLDALNTLTITDARGGSQTLYFGVDGNGEIELPLFEMPPAPPAGAFDARFETAEGGLMVQTHAAGTEQVVEYPITVQAEAYPLTVSWQIKGGQASYVLADGVGGEVFAPKSLAGEGELTISNPALHRVVLKLTGGSEVPAEYALWQNYPNPFNPTTNIKFALPVQSRVTVEVYNIIGQRVRTLVNGELPAAYHVVEWNGTGNTGLQLGSGVYFVRLSADGTDGRKFTEIRKLMMLK